MSEVMTEENVRPIYDERVNEILDVLAKNVSRENIAKRFGHKNYKSLDMYMRRRNFTWDSERKTYVPRLHGNQSVPERIMPKTKSGIVIEMMKDKSVDIEEVCDKVGFKNHRQLAEYMTEKGYRWSPSESNYIKVAESNQDRELLVISQSNSMNESKSVRQMTNHESINERFLRFLPLLEELEANRDKLLEMVKPMGKGETLPRYVIPGRTSGKTIQMAEPLQDMAVQYCNERNIKQRELFEMALIEFLKRNGYDYEVANLIGTY